MCTGFVRRGSDLIMGFNMDLALGAWDYKVYMKPDMFYIGIKVGSTVYKVHGINSNGNFGNMPYMNDPAMGVFHRGRDFRRLDLMVDKYIAGKMTLSEIKDVADTKHIVNIPNASMHSLLCNRDGDMIIVEPGIGACAVDDKYAVISNFPLLENVGDLSAEWYGKDRYDKAVDILQNSGDDFTVGDGMKLLHEVRQEGKWATRVSFVYSQKENAVYYVLNNDFASINKHNFI